MKRLFVTGATTGIGLDAALFFMEKGYEVWASFRKSEDESRLKNLQLNPVQMDVSNPDSIAKAIAQLPDEFDVIINNAGLAVGGPVEALSWNDWKLQLETNVLGLVEVTRLMIPKLRKRQGRVINIGSISGKIASPMMAAYNASKFAVEGISDALRRELRSQKIKVVLVEPGPIQTPIWEKAKSDTIKRIEEFPASLRDIYKGEIEAVLRGVEKSEKAADPVHKVTKVIWKAATLRNPKTRYPVGRGISIASWMSNHFPDRWLDALVRFQ